MTSEPIFIDHELVSIELALYSILLNLGAHTIALNCEFVIREQIISFLIGLAVHRGSPASCVWPRYQRRPLWSPALPGPSSVPPMINVSSSSVSLSTSCAMSCSFGVIEAVSRCGVPVCSRASAPDRRPHHHSGR